MLLELLLVLLVLAAIAASVLSFFIARNKNQQRQVPVEVLHDTDNPQRDIDEK